MILLPRRLLPLYNLIYLLEMVRRAIDAFPLAVNKYDIFVEVGTILIGSSKTRQFGFTLNLQLFWISVGRL